MAKTKRGSSVASQALRDQRVLARQEQQKRNQSHVQQGILSEDKFLEVHKQAKQGFADVMRTTLGNEFSQQGLLREIRPEDLQKFVAKIEQLQGRYEGGIKPEQVIQASLPVDRARSSREIPWAHAVASKYLGRVSGKGDPLMSQGAKQSLVVSFVTAASGKNGASKHFVNVEFLKFGTITKHLLMDEPSEAQAHLDAEQLKHSAVCFDCDCGRHTYWYRYIATTGKFAYVGTNPIGRRETGFPKIRNPNLKGIACKHVLRTMQTILRDKSFHNFLVKSIMKKYKAGNAQKTINTQTTKREMEKAISRMTGENVAILSTGEKFIAPKLLERYQKSLSQTAKSKYKDTKNAKQKLNVLAQLHDVKDKLKYL